MQFKNIFVIFLMLVISSCVSTKGATTGPKKAKVENPDIYSQLTGNQVENRVEEVVADKGSPEWVEQNVIEIRASYFRKDYESAKILGEKTLKLVPATLEVYYWLARIAMDEADFQVAHDNAVTGIGFAKPKDKKMKDALEEIKTQAQVGAN